jgi:hypothetical protein
MFVAYAMEDRIKVPDVVKILGVRRATKACGPEVTVESGS